MKNILSLIISGALVVSGFGQTRNVLVGTNNAVVQPTNFWSADASNARTGLGLGTAATNPASAFQPSSATLSNLATSNGGSLTNLQSANLVGVIPASNIPSTTLTNISGTLSIASGGTGATNAATARTNLGLGWSALTNTDATNFRNAIGLGTTNSVTFETVNLGGLYLSESVIRWETNDIIEPETRIFFGEWTFDSGAIQIGGATNRPLYQAQTRTNLGLPWSGLTNTNAATFQAALFGSNTNPVLVNTNGEVVSPTNFWAVAPISTTVQYQTNVTGTSTNAATNSRNLFLFSLSPSVSGVTNTVTLPTNPATTFEGDRATITHLANSTNAVTAIRQLGAESNLITLNQLDETVLLMYRSGAWRLADNISYIEPIYFSGTNAAANAAASRTNLGLGTTNSVTFESLHLTRAAASSLGPYIFTFGQTNTGIVGAGGGPSDYSFTIQGNVIFSITTNTFSIGVPTTIDESLEFSYGAGAEGVISFGGLNAATGAAISRTNLGLGATWLTNANVTNFRTAIGLGATNDVTVNSLTIAEGTNTYIALFDDGGEFSTGITMSGNSGISFSSNAAGITRTNLGLGATNIVTFAGLTNNGDITINSTTASNGLLFIRRTNNEPFLGLANLVASNNITVGHETLFRVGTAEATNKSAQFGFRATNTNGDGLAVFSTFGYNALMMVGPSDRSRTNYATNTNAGVEADIWSISPTNRVATLITTNTGATLFHRPIEFNNTTNQAVTRTNIGLGGGITTNYGIGGGVTLFISNGIITNITP